MVHTSALSDSYYLVTQAHVSFMSCLLGKNFNFSLHFVFHYWDYASLSHLLKSFTSHYVFFSLDKGLGKWARPNTYTPATSLPVSPKGIKCSIQTYIPKSKNQRIKRGSPFQSFSVLCC